MIEKNNLKCSANKPTKITADINVESNRKNTPSDAIISRSLGKIFYGTLIVKAGIISIIATLGFIGQIALGIIGVGIWMQVSGIFNYVKNRKQGTMLQHACFCVFIIIITFAIIGCIFVFTNSSCIIPTSSGTCSQLGEIGIRMLFPLFSTFTFLARLII